MKFFTRLCFIAISMSLSTLNAQVLIRNTSTQKSKEIDFGRTIYFKLFSDSVLGIELIKEMGILTTTSDSNFIFSDGMEVPIGDIKYLEIESKKTKNWQGLTSPFLVSGIAFLTAGITMAITEGYGSENATKIPLYAGFGGGITFLASIPFWVKNKSYDLTTGNYEILIP
jgi:hypothetical protein